MSWKWWETKQPLFKNCFIYSSFVNSSEFNIWSDLRTYDRHFEVSNLYFSFCCSNFHGGEFSGGIFPIFSVEYFWRGNFPKERIFWMAFSGRISSGGIFWGNVHSKEIFPAEGYFKGVQAGSLFSESSLNATTTTECQVIKLRYH